MRRLVGTACAGLVVLACTGADAPVPLPVGKAYRTPTSSGSTPEPQDDRPASFCREAEAVLDRACIPGVGIAGLPITIEVDRSEGCAGCNTQNRSCLVDLAASVVTVHVVAERCDAFGTACSSVCNPTKVECTLPPLTAGTYVLHIEHEQRNALRPPRELVVAKGGVNRCKLASGGTLQATSYVQTCAIDTDCILATVGDPCVACACPGTAIRASESERYAADVRALSSLCAPPKGEPMCMPCAAAKAVCNASKVCEIAAEP